MDRRSSAAARQEHRFDARMDLPTPVGCTFDRTAGLASPWVQWSNGGVDTCPQGKLRWQLSVILHGQLPPRAPRPSSSTKVSSSRRQTVRGRLQSSNSATLPPISRPAVPRPRADWSPFPPCQVARSSPPSPPTAAARRLAVTGAQLRLWPRPAPSPPPEEVLRARYAYAVRVHARRAHACTLSLTYPD